MAKIRPSDKEPFKIPPTAMEKSSLGIQIQSKGGRLPTSLKLYLDFMWRIKTIWKKATYSDLQKKRPLANQLADQILKMCSLKPEEIPLVRHYLKCQLEQFSIKELKNPKELLESIKNAL